MDLATTQASQVEGQSDRQNVAGEAQGIVDQVSETLGHLFSFLSLHFCCEGCDENAYLYVATLRDDILAPAEGRPSILRAMALP